MPPDSARSSVASPVFFASLVGAVVENMQGAFPELTDARERVERIIRDEEELFAKTLGKGVRKFENMTKNMKEGEEVSGVDAFLLYQSFGFPVDLTTLMAEERKLKLDLEGFEAEYKRVQELSRASGKSDDLDEVPHMHLDADATAKLKETDVPTTDDLPKYTADLSQIGLPDGGVDAQVLAIAVPTSVAGCTEFKDGAESGELVGVVLDTTCFYAESGGQIFDTGVLSSDTGHVAVKNTQVFAGYVLHIGTLSGTLSKGSKVKAVINAERRRPIMANHTMTHVLNFALRKALVYRDNADVSADTKVPVDQRGSLVDEEKLRFDFSYPKKLDDKEVAAVEDACNAAIKADLAVDYANVSLADAMGIQGLRAVFGEVYPDPVRVVSVGPKVADLVAQPKNFTEWKEFSVELCGGTHLQKTSEAGGFVLLSEGGIAQGVRRIIGVTGSAAVDATRVAAALESQLAEVEKAAGARRTGDVAAVKKEYTAVKEALDTAQIPLVKRIALNVRADAVIKQLIAADKSGGAAAADAARQVIEDAKAADPKPKFIVKNLTEAAGDRKTLDTGFQAFKKELVNDPAFQIPVLVCTANEKMVTIMAAVSSAAVKEGSTKLIASDWAKHVAAAVGGKGGGKPDSAQGTGKEVAKIDDAIKAAEEFATEKLSQ